MAETFAMTLFSLSVPQYMGDDEKKDKMFLRGRNFEAATGFTSQAFDFSGQSFWSQNFIGPVRGKPLSAPDQIKEKVRWVQNISDPSSDSYSCTK